MTCSSTEFRSLLKNTLSRYFHSSIYNLPSLIFLAFASFLPEAGGKLIWNCLKYMRNLNFFFLTVYFLCSSIIEPNDGLCELSVPSPWSSSRSSLLFCNLQNFCNLLTVLVPYSKPWLLISGWDFWGNLCFPTAKTASLILDFVFRLLDNFNPQQWFSSQIFTFLDNFLCRTLSKDWINCLLYITSVTLTEF